jgi:hypothetical protein
MARLILNSITCIDTAEVFNDELYVVFNGTRASLPNMQTGEAKTLGLEFIFAGTQVLNLFENDGNHWWDRDDFIGKHEITESHPGDVLVFDGRKDGDPTVQAAQYQISVTVVPLP